MVPHQKTPLASTARCDQLPTYKRSGRREKNTNLFQLVKSNRQARRKVIIYLIMVPMVVLQLVTCNLWMVSITGVGNHLIPQKRIGCYCAVSRSTMGDCLCIYAEYACVLEQPTSIHSVIQLEHYKNKVDDKHWLLNGTQSITNPTGKIFPLVFKNGLCYLPQQYPTDIKMVTLPQVIITSDEEGDPSIYTTNATMDEQINALPLISKGTHDDDYDEEGKL